MRLARRILPFAACVVIVVAGLAVPQIRQKIPQKPQKPGEEKPAVEGVYAPQEVASAEKLTDAAGFPVRDIASLKEKATDRSYVHMGMDWQRSHIAGIHKVSVSGSHRGRRIIPVTIRTMQKKN